MMNNKSSEQRMQYYSETFDFYMDSEDHPDFEPARYTWTIYTIGGSR